MPDTEPGALHALLQFPLTTTYDKDIIVISCNSEEVGMKLQGVKEFGTNDDLGFETKFM